MLGLLLWRGGFAEGLRVEARGVGRRRCPGRVCAHISLGSDWDGSVPTIRVTGKPLTRSRAGLCECVCVSACAYCVRTCVRELCVCKRMSV